MYTHKCIKPNCSNTYEDEDADAYYCPSCNIQREAIAKEIDAKRVNIKRKKVVSELAHFDSLTKGRGGFVDARKLGI